MLYNGIPTERSDELYGGMSMVMDESRVFRSY